ncbi:MAG: FAD-dependent oxidoreductase [Clostridiales bacterium]|nr:FAD-dependent oxidoreductase [Clostridiales bacterium]
MACIMFQREIEVRHNVDVLVVGGGPAGIAAALTAARQGKKVFLAEAHSCLGGMGTAGMVPAFMLFSDGVNFLAAGVGEVVLNKMHEYGGKIEGWNLSIKAEALKRVYDDLLLDAGVDFTLHTQMVALDAADGKVNYVVFAAKSGMFAVKAKIYIDGTGDGDLAAWAGAKYEKGDADGRMMAGTLCSLWANIDWDRVQKPDTRRIEDAFKDKVFTYEDRHLPGMWRVGNTLGGGNIGHTFGVDSTDEVSLTKALIWGRKSLVEYEKYYKEYLDGYENMELVATGSLLGIRESRRIIGDYVMVLDDFLNRAVFDDEIGRYAYPVDIHASDSSKESFSKFEKEHKSYRYKKGENYGIPYRILTPAGLDNVLVSGRCVSCDRYIQSSIRVMPGCYITGQAAGMAAAIAAEQNTHIRGFDVRELQRRLKKMGAFLPNFQE